MKGFIFYRGASLIDGAPVVGIATLKTSNRKTGDMVQTWILRDDIDPVAASDARLDSSICGNCPHRQNTGGACYVNIGQAPLSVWRAYKRGIYPEYSPENHDTLLSGRMIRLGAYGDPAAIPFDIWADLVTRAKGHTGYTHQAGRKFFDFRILSLCMASADTPRQAAKLQASGARTFRVAVPGDMPAESEIECLSDSKGISCADCGLCDGASGSPSVFIRVHGSRAGKFNAPLIPSIDVTEARP